MFSLTNVLLGMVLVAMWIVASAAVRAGCTGMKISKMKPTDRLFAPELSEATAIPGAQSNPYSREITYSRGLNTHLRCSHNNESCSGEELHRRADQENAPGSHRRVGD